MTGQYVCSAEGTAVTDEHLNTTNDTVVEQSIPHYDFFGRVWMSKRYRRNSYTAVASLSSSNSRLTHVVAWWDGLGRTQYVADYGTNGGTQITDSSYGTANVDFDGDDANETYAAAQSGMLTGTSKLILTKYTYDVYSRPYLVTDNNDKDTATFFDDAGRRTHVVENYDPNTCT